MRFTDDVSMASKNTTGPSTRAAISLDWIRHHSPNLTPFQQFFRDVDWSNTSIGPTESWPRELRQMALFMVAEVNPAIIHWGDEDTLLYNEAYIPLVGEKHPQLMGMNAKDVFPDFWDDLREVIDRQKQQGFTHIAEESMLLMKRRGFMEETYFNWHMIPIIGDDGEMLGTYGRPIESTHEVIHLRRMATIKALSEKIADAVTWENLWSSICTGIGGDDKDIPLAAVYSVESKGIVPVSCELKALLGLRDGHPIAKQHFHLETDVDGFGGFVAEAVQSGEIVEVQADDPKIAEMVQDVTWRGFGIPSRSFIIVPVPGDTSVPAVMIFGLNPRLHFDKLYREFVQTLAGVIAPQITRIRLTQDAESRAEAAKRAARGFQESEMKFSKFAARSPVALALTDSEGKVLYANEAWLDFVGLSEGDIEFANWVDTVVEEDVDMLRDWWYRMTVLKESGTFEIRTKVPFERGHMKSKYKTGLCACYADTDEEGNMTTAMGIILDISEQKWVQDQLLARQQELLASEAKYRNFSERSPHGMVRTDEHGFVEFGNDAWYRYYGFEKGSLNGSYPWAESIVDGDREKAQEYFDQVKTSKDPIAIEIRIKNRRERPESNLPDLERPWLLVQGWAEHRADGSIDHLIFWVADITEQKAAAQILQDKMDEAIRSKTQQERFIDMISHEIRNPLSAVLHCGEEIVDSMKKCLTTMDAMPIPTKESDLQNTTRSEVNSAMEAANTIMYCVQHQKQIVDDVLTLSKLDSDLLIVSPVPVQPTEMVQSALRIFEPELKASDIEFSFVSDKSLDELNGDWILLDPNRFLQIVINLITNAIKFTKNSTTKQIVVTVSLRHDEPLSNSRGVDYVPRRTTPKVGLGLDQPLYLCLSVSDTGRGLSDSDKATLFNRFSQGSPKTHVEYGGSGLGLFISRQITEMLGGEIGVGIKESGGCTFAFFAKTARVSPPRRDSIDRRTSQTNISTVSNDGKHARPMAVGSKPVRAPKIVPPAKPGEKKRKVLVVEDNLINQKVLCKQLRTRGFVVTSANHGQEALTALHETSNGEPVSNFDVILCDIEMPVMDGIECVTEIRRQEKHGQLPGHIPIIAVTANVRSTQVNNAIDAGMDGVTTKPYRIDDLISHIDRVCKEID